MRKLDLKKYLLEKYRELPTKSRRLPIFIAVSSGMDSSVLAHLAWTLRDSLPNITWLHVNYHLRKPASDREEGFLRGWANQTKIPLFVRSLRPPKSKSNLQDWARKMRYQFFQEVIEKAGGGTLWVAHHLQDQTETFIQRLLRGSGWGGLGAMKEWDDWPEIITKKIHLKIFRPFLDVPRKAIAIYAKFHTVKFRQDASNRTLTYQRNRIRHVILPLLERENPRVQEALGHLSRQFNFLDGEMTHHAQNWLHRHSRKGGRQLRIKDLEGCRTLESTAIIRAFLCQGGLFPQGYGVILSRTLKYLERPKARLRIPLKGGWTLSMTPQNLEIQTSANLEPKVRQVSSTRLTLFRKGIFPLKKFNAKIEIKHITIRNLNVFNNKDLKTAYLDLSHAQFPLSLRFPRQGERFMPLGTEHLKNIRRFLMDQKVPRAHRQAPMLYSASGNPLWLVGHRIDHRAKLQPTSQKALRVRWKGRLPT